MTTSALQPTIPHLKRSSLHCCLQRDDVGRLPDVSGDRPARKKSKVIRSAISHVDTAEARAQQGKLHMFVAVDRTWKFAVSNCTRRLSPPSRASSFCA